MKLVFVENGVATLYGRIERFAHENPSVAIPDPVTDEFLASHNLYPVVIKPPRQYDIVVERPAMDPPRQADDGTWVIDISVNRIPEADAAHGVRSKRNQIIASCDWTQLQDSPADSAAWATYRQELRDLPQQAGFPYSVVWPTEPTS